MKDFNLTAINPVTGDMEEVTGIKADKQWIENLLSLQKGEWFLNENLGVDWLGLQEKKADTGDLKDQIRLQLRKASYTDVGLIQVNHNPATRLGNVKVTIKSQTVEVDKNL